MTVGRSEQAKTLVVESDRKVLSTVGWVPRVTFLRSLSRPTETASEKGGKGQGDSWAGKVPKQHLQAKRREASLPGKALLSPVSMLSPK